MTKKQIIEDLEAVLSTPTMNVGALRNKIHAVLQQHRPAPKTKEPAPTPAPEPDPEPANQMAPSVLAKPAEKPASDDLDDW